MTHYLLHLKPGFSSLVNENRRWCHNLSAVVFALHIGTQQTDVKHRV
jgi:hypothetical protein